MRHLLTTCLLLIAAMVAVNAAEPTAPVTDPGAAAGSQQSMADADTVSKGRCQFEATCSPCHGAGGRGGRGGAPDLLISPVAMGEAGQFKSFVRSGSPSGAMPGFPMQDVTLEAVQAYLLKLGAEAKRRGNRDIALVGDAARGRANFEGLGHCNSCHSVTGDLSGIGSRYKLNVLQGRLVLPRGSGVHPGLLALGVKIPGVTDETPVRDSPRTVAVDQPGGAITGTLLSISDFDVALRDGAGTYRSFARTGSEPRVVIHDPAQPHIDRLGLISDEDMHDLTAFLATLK